MIQCNVITFPKTQSCHVCIVCSVNFIFTVPYANLHVCQQAKSSKVCINIRNGLILLCVVHIILLLGA